MKAQSWEEFYEACREDEHRKLDMMEKELERLTDKEASLLMGFYGINGPKASMRELAQRLGYDSDTVAKSTKARIIKKMCAGIQQQERALDNGLSPVAFFMVTEVRRRIRC